MTSLVVDASVAVKLYFAERDSDRALQIVANEDLLLHAPDILVAEVANALLRRERDREISAVQVDRALCDLLAIASTLTASSSLMEDTTRIAREMRHPVYDCFYLALAVRLDVTLVTADVTFVERCRERAPAHAARIVLLSQMQP